MFEKIHGMKTYITAMGLIMYAIGGFVAGKIDINNAALALFNGLGLMGLRHRVEAIKGIFDEIKSIREQDDEDKE